MNEDLLEIEIESTAETMIDELSRSIRKLTQKTYEKAYKTLIEEWSGTTVKTKELPTDDLIDNELYDTITLWIANFKTWLFENINSAFDDSFSEEKSFVQKGLFDNFFDGIKEAFEKTKGKIETITRNANLNAQTVAQKIAFKV